MSQNSLTFHGAVEKYQRGIFFMKQVSIYNIKQIKVYIVLLFVRSLFKIG